MIERSGFALWDGDLKTGTGLLRSGSGMVEAAYSFGSRFQEDLGTNPEELIATAHAGCFTMALSQELTQSGYTPQHIQTTANVYFEKVRQGYQFTRITLHTKAQVPDLDEPLFAQKAEEAKNNCPVSKALTGVNIELQAHLVNKT
ncbi:MAG: OsmC family peroxiredoxin [bacterium]